MKPAAPAFLAALASVLVLPAVAQEDPDGGGFLQAPTLPPPDVGGPGASVEEGVTIRETPEGTIYEYRANGKIYMVKVQPVMGPPYYFLDLDGDGQVDDRRERLEPDSNVNQWMLHQW